MRHSLALVPVLLVVLGGCSPRSKAPSPDVSGFLDDYSLLREGAAGEVALVYRNPKADWTSYDTVLFEPVTLWRSGRGSLGPIPEDDLLRLLDLLETSVRRRLGERFRLVDKPGPGAMRIRLAITEARASDPTLDVLRARGTGEPGTPVSAAPLHPEMRRFIEAARIEGEIRDANTDELLAAGVDRRRRTGAPPIDTWVDVQRAIDSWAERLCERMAARAQGTIR